MYRKKRKQLSQLIRKNVELEKQNFLNNPIKSEINYREIIIGINLGR